MRKKKYQVKKAAAFFGRDQKNSDMFALIFKNVRLVYNIKNLTKSGTVEGEWIWAEFFSRAAR